MAEGAFVGGILSGITRSVSDNVKLLLNNNPWILILLGLALVIGALTLLTNKIIKEIKKYRSSKEKPPEPDPKASLN